MTLPKTLLIVAALVMVIVYLVFRLETKNRQLESKTSALEETQAVIREFRTAQGKTATEKVTAEVSKGDLKDHYPEVAKELADLKIKINQLKGVLSAVVEAKGKGEVIIVRDTIRVPGAVPVILDSVKINDGYLRFKGQGKNGLFGYGYSYTDSITFAVATKKKWFLGSEKLYGTGKLQNPNAKITNQTSLVIKNRDKRWNVSAGVGYDFYGKRIVPTVYAGYSLIRF
jgi:type II secretory pathway pseudopilin PulG